MIWLAGAGGVTSFAEAGVVDEQQSVADVGRVKVMPEAERMVGIEPADVGGEAIIAATHVDRWCVGWCVGWCAGHEVSPRTDWTIGRLCPTLVANQIFHCEMFHIVR